MGNKAKVPYRHWERDDEKEKFWRKTIGDWITSGLTARAFCRKHNVPESSFNAWRREISMRDREQLLAGKPVDPRTTAEPPAVVKDARGRVVRSRFREAHLLLSDQASKQQISSKQPSTSFIPIKLVQTREPDEASERPISCVEIVMPRGMVLRVNVDIDIAFLSNLIRSLEAQQC